MGSRAGRIPLSKIEFRIAPGRLADRIDAIEDDPEATGLNNTYVHCYRTVFKRRPPDGDSVYRHRIAIIRAARNLGESLRLYILANMVAHQVAQFAIVSETERANAVPFRASMLVGGLALTRCKQYAENCRSRFGTFALSGLGTLVNEDYEADDIETAMLNSEVTAGRFIVQYKTYHKGSPFEDLYQHEELALSPYWLAIEPSYEETVLARWRVNRTGSEALQRHRFDVHRTQQALRKNTADRLLMFGKRQRMLPEAVRTVLSLLHYSTEDFLVDPVPVTDPTTFWITLGRTIQHYNVRMFLNGEQSVFNRSR